ncbi:WD repeat-containing protein 7-like isoform X2 [Oscarella lobularis]|uniref:WD repeat-containing protein 7-like isoform X2 n=1 Tax=Oscarella lobularis TaxID=121494 RepID=UPI00331382B6
MASSTVIPLVLWGKKAPSHDVTCIMLTNDQKTIVTGSSDGQICLWSLRMAETDTKIFPRNLLFGHDSSVTALTNASNSADSSAVISSSRSGQIFAWNPEDGACLKMTKLAGCHTDLTVFSILKNSDKEWRLICHGEYLDIYILDPSTLEVLNKLKQRGNPEWISTLCFIRSPKREDGVVVSLSYHGCIKVWTLENLDNKIEDPILEQKTSFVTDVAATSLRCNPFTNASALVVCQTHWTVYDISSGDFSELSKCAGPENVIFRRGDFVSKDSIVVWSERGSAYVYKFMSDGKTEWTATFATDLPDGKLSLCYSFSFGRKLPIQKYLVQGTSEGCVFLWKVNEETFGQSKEPLLPCASASLRNSWEQNAYCGLIDGLCDSDDGRNPPVTSSLYLASSGYLLCGRQDGSIIVVVAIQAAVSQILESKGWQIAVPHILLRGHRCAVTTLLYPHGDDPVRYSEKYLVSGSDDFTVRLWDLAASSLLHTFTVHGGKVQRLYTCPPGFQDPRLNCSICSVASDNSVALLSLKERKAVLLASCHKFPVRIIHWRPAENFMIASCTDGTVYVWQTDSGHLDRCESGIVARNILRASSAYPIRPAFPLSSYPPPLGISGVVSESKGSRLPLDVQAYRCNPDDPLFLVLCFDLEALISILSSRDASLPSGVSLVSHGNSPVPLQVKGRLVTASTPPPPSPSSSPAAAAAAAATSSRSGKEDFQRYLAARRVIGKVGASSSTASKERRVVKQAKRKAKKILADSRASGSPGAVRRRALTLGMGGMEGGLVNFTQNVAKLVVSCLHAWKVDESMDDTCCTVLGLARPKRRLSFGLLSRGNASFLMSSPHGRGGGGKATDSGCELARFQEYQWEVSSSVTTQQLLAIVSMANTLMSYASLEASENLVASISPLRKEELVFNLESTKQQGSPSSYLDAGDAQVRAAWSRMAAMHCVMLADHIGKEYRAPMMTVLAEKWQHSCQEIREAAQALLQAELHRMDEEGRANLIRFWYPLLPPLTSSSSSSSHSFITSSIKSSPPSPPPLSGIDAYNAGYDKRQRQATAVTLLGVIVAEFAKSRDGEKKSRRHVAASSSSRSRRESTPAAAAATTTSQPDIHVIQRTAQSLESLLLDSPSPKYSVNHPVRRAMIDLVGRGFAHWVEHVDTVRVVNFLLELSCETKSNLRPVGQTTKTSSAAVVDYCEPNSTTCHVAKHALVLCAMARPMVFITVVAKEVAAFSPSTAASAMLADLRHAGEVHGTVGGSGTKSATGSTGGSASGAASAKAAQSANSIVVRARKTIIHVMETLVEKMPEEAVFQLLEIMDVIVHCIDASVLKAHGLSKVFPLITKFNMMSYCQGPRRLAVGSRDGHIAIYELKGLRCHLLAAHSCPITALAFSNEGRTLASYSTGDSKISVWHTGSSFFGMLSSTPRLLRSFTTEPCKPRPVLQLMKTVNLVWVSQKKIVLITDGKEQQFTL